MPTISHHVSRFPGRRRRLSATCWAWTTAALTTPPWHVFVMPSWESPAQALVGRHMLGVDEERALLADLPVPPADRWLQLLYQCALSDCALLTARQTGPDVHWRAPHVSFQRCKAQPHVHGLLVLAPCRLPMSAQVVAL